MNSNSEPTYFYFVYLKPQISQLSKWKYSFLNENTFAQQNLLKMFSLGFVFYVWLFAQGDFCIMCIL